MDGRKYRTYPKEFKLEALEMLKRSGKSAGQIERELGITPGLLVEWRARYQVLQQGKQEVQLGPSDLEGAKGPQCHKTKVLSYCILPMECN
jgi:transposase-like protein